MTSIGHDKPLYILPFDHRGTFQAQMFGCKGTLMPKQTAQIAGGWMKVVYSDRAPR